MQAFLSSTKLFHITCARTISAFIPGRASQCTRHHSRTRCDRPVRDRVKFSASFQKKLTCALRELSIDVTTGSSYLKLHEGRALGSKWWGPGFEAINVAIANVSGRRRQQRPWQPLLYSSPDRTGRQGMLVTGLGCMAGDSLLQKKKKKKGGGTTCTTPSTMMQRTYAYKREYGEYSNATCSMPACVTLKGLHVHHCSQCTLGNSQCIKSFL